MNGFGGIIAYSNKDIYEERTVMQKIFDFLEGKKQAAKANQLVTIAQEIQNILDEFTEEFMTRYIELKKTGIIHKQIADVLDYPDELSPMHQEFAISAQNREAILWNNEETLRKLQTTPEKLLGRAQPEITDTLAWY